MINLAQYATASLIVSLTIAGLATHLAAEEVYVPTATKTSLVQEALPGIEGKQITVDRYTLPPGYVGGKHYHTGPVYVYIIEGSFTVEETGKAAQELSAGQLYKEPIGTHMQARNVSNSDAVEILVIQVGKEGEPLMYKAE